jgi:hypothetical protein
MTVALSILFASLVGGVVFALVDNVGRREPRAPAPPPPPPPPEPPREPRVPNPPPVPDRLWSGWARD